MILSKKRMQHDKLCLKLFIWKFLYKIKKKPYTPFLSFNMMLVISRKMENYMANLLVCTYIVQAFYTVKYLIIKFNI